MIKGMVKLGWLVALWVAIAQLQTSVCRAWSLNPFASAEAQEPKPRKVTAKPVKHTPPPSTWDQLTSGTKQFFNKTGETLGLKKPEPRRPSKTAMAIPRQPKLEPRKKSEQKSWLGSMFEPEEPESKTVSQWLGSTKQINP